MEESTDQPTNQTVNPPTSAPAGKKILLIDDDPGLVQLYSTVFSSVGFNFSIAQGGAEGLEKAKMEHPDLILLDIMLPDINGLEVLKRLKQDPQTANTTVWMMTNLAEQLNQETASSLGATGYLVKAETSPKAVCDKISAFFGSSPQPT